MIYTERVINVKNGVATIDQSIVLFRGDRNIEIVFEIINSKFKFSEKGNYILDIGAKYGQLAVEMPDGTDLFTEIAECLDGKVIFKITGDMINEIAENGFYSFHVRLFNDDKTSRVTIPPIMEGIEIREPIVIEGDAIFPIVDMGGVDIAPIDSDEETFIDENGKLDIQWKTGDIISSTRLNQMVEYVNILEEKLASEDNLKDYATIEYVDTELDAIDTALHAHEGYINDIESTAEQAKRVATEARNTIDDRYIELNMQIDQLISTDERFDASVAAAEANAQAALAGVNDRATVSYVDRKDTELSQRIDTLGESVDQNKRDIASLDGRVLNIENQMADVAFDLLREDIEGAIKQIEDLRNTHDQDLANKGTDIGNLQNQIDDHESRILTLEQVEAPDLSIYATTEYVDSEINEYVDAMNQLDVRVNSNTSVINDLEDTCNEFDDRVGALETAIEILPDDPANPTENECVTERYVKLNFVEGRYLGANYYNKEYVDEQFNSQNETINDHTTRITALEEAGGGNADLTGYATTEYVDGQISDIQTAIEILPDDPANPTLSECVIRQYVYDNFTPKAMHTMLKTTVNRIEEYIPYGYDPTNPGENECVTRQYLEANYYNSLKILSTFVTSAAVDKKINDAIGDINAILDAINGEEI